MNRRRVGIAPTENQTEPGVDPHLIEVNSRSVASSLDCWPTGSNAVLVVLKPLVLLFICDMMFAHDKPREGSI